MRLFIHTLLAFLLLLTLSSTVWAEVKAFLNQDTFYEGDPITLNIEISGKGHSKPNLSPLEKDFDILGTSSSTQINILNGHRRVKKSWTIELQPKRKGSLQIPVIHIGQETTSVVNFKIIDIPADIEEKTKNHIFVESSVDIAGDFPYVQQQIPYTVKLYYDANMLSGKIYSPSVENAVVEQLGEDRRYRTIRNGKKYSVLEKHFVISPEKSGILHIPPTTVKGRMSSTNPNKPNRQKINNQDTDFLNRFFNNSPFANDPFFKDFGGDFFSNRHTTASKPFTASSEAIDVNVQPLPASFTGKLWLPAEELTIEDSWTTSPPELRVGEPVTRVLRLQAKGLAGSQIPKIDIPKPNNMRTYPEQEKTETRTDGKTVYGISEMNISYIPDASGNITIPAIKLDWWNVITKKQETFILPEWNLTVTGAVGAVAEANKQSNINSSTDAQTTMDAKQNPTIDSPTETTTNNLIYWLLSLLTLIIMAGLGYFYGSSKKSRLINKTANNTLPLNNNINAILNTLQKSCNNNQPHEAEKHLLHLANVSWKGNNPPQNLGALAVHITKGKKAVLALQKSLYAKNNAEWKGAHLWNAVKNGLQIKSTNKQHDVQLKPLYPTL